MTWKPIVAGVDASPEGVRAAVEAARLAEKARTKCFLVHAVRDPWTEMALADTPMSVAEQNRLVLDSSRTLLVEYLRAKVPESLLDRMEVRFGSPPVVVSAVADEHDAELVVLGGKHHSAIGRWLAGSTVHHMVRRLDRPILVTGPLTQKAPGGSIRRVLAAVDLSRAAAPTLDAAERFATLFGSHLRALHVFEPLPILPELPVGLEGDVFRRWEDELESDIWPRISIPDSDKMVRRGPAADTIAEVASEWDADLLVLGTHGRGWVDRMLIGSVTERLLNRLPTSILVIPISAPAHLVRAGTPATTNGKRPRPAAKPTRKGARR
jgi:nucleotide-binding universal stress UspA family protein